MEWLYPCSLEELLEIKAKYGKRAVIVGGGTFLGLHPPSNVEYLVDTSRAGLSFINIKDRFIEVGAGVTISELLFNKEIERVGMGMIKKGGKRVATHPLRNRITVGGNVVYVFPWSDLPPIFLAINGTFFTLNSEGGFRTFSADQWFSKQPHSLLKDDEILYKIELPIDDKDIVGDVIKFTFSEVEDTIITVAVYGILKKQTVKEIRIAVGGCESLPKRLTTTEEFLLGKEITKELLEEVYIKARQEIYPRWQDRRVDPVYKKEIGAVLLRDILSTFIWGKSYET